jgi:uncharacterized membrane protein
MLIGWGLIVASWVVPYVIRKQPNTFESHIVGIVLAAIALVFFVIDLVIHLTKEPLF